jgi:hypothetical protein
LIGSHLSVAVVFFWGAPAAAAPPLRSVDDHELGVGPVTRDLQNAYLETVHGRGHSRPEWHDRPG